MKRKFLLPWILVFLILSSCALPPIETPTSLPAQTPEPNPVPSPVQKLPTLEETQLLNSPLFAENATFKLETKNLRIYYPNFVDEAIAQDQAKILQQAYDFYYNLIGQEYPYNGKIIEIVFDSSRGNTSSSGNPIVMGLDSGIFDSKILPPEPAYFHELVHDFTTRDKTSVAKYVDINGAITEAFADLFTYYFGLEELKYSKDDISRYTQGVVHFSNALKEYETKKIDPYSLDWGDHKDAQPYICSIFLYLEEEYGWEIWNRFFQVARSSNVSGIPLNRQGSFIDLRRTEDAIVFGDFVYILSIASGENLIPIFEHWGFHFEKQTKEKILNMYKTHSIYLSGLAGQYFGQGLSKQDSEEYSQAIEELTLSMRIYQNLGEVQKVEEIEALITEIKSENIIIDGVIDEWLPTAVVVLDPSKDVLSRATSDKGTDLKAVYALMDGKYLYVAIQIYGVFDPSIIGNYFIALDFDKDKQDEYHFGVRLSGNTWVFDHTTDKNNWNGENTSGVTAMGGTDTIEIRIPREDYKIPSSISIYCRVTEGGPTVDATGWFAVSQTTIR